MKRVCLGICLLLSMAMLLCGCQLQAEEAVVVELPVVGSGAETASSEEGAETASSEEDAEATALMDLHGHKGEMTYELLDAYVTENPLKAGVDLEKLDPYSFIEIEENGDIQDINYPGYFADLESGELVNGCRMFVCRIKVTNVDAVYEYENEYDSPYTFRADNIALCSRVDNESYHFQCIDYYSRRQEGDSTWATYEVEPGESLIYEVGFLVGDAYSEDGELTVIPDGEVNSYYLSNVTGGSSGTFYHPDWRVKR